MTSALQQQDLLHVLFSEVPFMSSSSRLFLSQSSRGKLLARQSPKGVHSAVQKEPRETAGGTLSEAPSLNHAAKEEGSFQVDLRVHGVSQDDTNKDEERMTEMRHVVDRLQDGYHDKSIIKDLQQEVVSNVFSEESKHKF